MSSLSPLWSPLWLRLHVDAGSVMLALNELKTALWHLSQHVAGLAARSLPTKSDNPHSNTAWKKFYTDLCTGCLYLGGTLHCAGVHDLAQSFLQTSAGACELLQEDREWHRFVNYRTRMSSLKVTTIMLLRLSVAAFQVPGPSMAVVCHRRDDSVGDSINR